MTLASLIVDLQALAATTPDGGASLAVMYQYNFRGDCRDASPVQEVDIAEPQYLHGEEPCIVLSYK